MSPKTKRTKCEPKKVHGQMAVIWKEKLWLWKQSVGAAEIQGTGGGEKCWDSITGTFYAERPGGQYLL